MKILLSNKFYFPKGGDCIHAFGLEELLHRKGHEVAFFAMQHPENQPSPYAKYFPSEIDFNRKSLSGIHKSVLRPLASREVKHKFNRLLDDFQPDLVHVHNIHSQISPVIVEEAYKRDIPVIWSLHDYKLLCPRYDCRRNNEPCELCFSDKRNVMKYRCMKNSLPASVLAYMEAKKWHREKLSGYTSHFVCPSEFIRKKMIQGGFDPGQFTTINNFINLEQFGPVQREKEDYYCYVGRLSKEKGVETLLKAAMELPSFKLKVVGNGPQYEDFIEKYAHPNIEFCGFQPAEEVHRILANARFSVMPSECYENNPLAVIESLCLGTPFIGADTGGIPELVVKDQNGVLFESGNKADLKKQIHWMWDHADKTFDPGSIADEARNRFSTDHFYARIRDIYQDALSIPKSS